MNDKKRKKICIIMPGHWTHMMGGAEYQVKCIMDKLIEIDKYEIYFITRNVDPSYTPKGYKIILINNLFGNIRARYLLDAPALFKALKLIKPDIIYQRRGLAYTGYAVLYARKYDCKFIWHIAHDDDVTPKSTRYSFAGLKSYLEKRMIEYGIRGAEYIIAQTKDQARYMKRYFGKSPSTIMSNFHPFPNDTVEKSKPIQIIWIANLKPIKQPEIFLRLAEEFREKKGIHFTMIGKLPVDRWGAEIGEQIKKISNLQYLGVVSQEKVNAILSKADILVNTSKKEGFSNTFIQAWMREVPVVSLCVNPDNIFNNENLGYCSGSFLNMVDDVSRLVGNDNLRTEFGIAAKTYANEHFSEREVNKLLALI